MGSLLFSVAALVTVLLPPGLSAQNLRRLSRVEYEQLNGICGRTFIYGYPRGPVQRIAYGTAAIQGEFPWAVGLIKEGILACSASIISKYHVITAAHCVLQSQTKMSFSPWGTHLMREFSSPNLQTSFVLGGSTCADPTIMPSVYGVWNSYGYRMPRRLRINKIIVPISSVMKKKNCTWIDTYGQYRLSPSIPDVAILELEDPIGDMNDQMVPICVPSYSTPLPFEYTQYGFGLTEDWMSFSKSCFAELRKRRVIDSQILTLAQYDDKVLCEKMAFVHNPNEKPCGGDSGGGYSGMSYGKHYLFGVHKGTDTPVCGAYSSMPYSLYTKVSYYNDFLCYYTGVCPLGYDVYIDKNYVYNPEKVLLFTKERQSISVDEGNFGFLKRRESKNKTLETSL